MTPEEAIDVLKDKISPCVAGKWKEAVDVAISALQARDSETRKICDTCKHDPPSKKWPCVDCDMREPADRWESQECQTCKHYDDASEKCGECLELGIDNYEPKEMENSTESSLTQKELDVPDTNVEDMVSRQEAIDALDEIESEVADGDGFQYEKWRRYFCELPSAQPNLQPTCNQLATDCISRRAAIDATWKDPSYTDPLNVLTEVRDIIKALPSVQSDRCDTCRFAYYSKETDNNDK